MEWVELWIFSLSENVLVVQTINLELNQCLRVWKDERTAFLYWFNVPGQLGRQFPDINLKSWHKQFNTSICAEHIRSSDSLVNFRSGLKSHLFSSAYQRQVTHTPAPQIRPSTFGNRQLFNRHWTDLWNGSVSTDSYDSIGRIHDVHVRLCLTFILCLWQDNTAAGILFLIF